MNASGGGTFRVKWVVLEESLPFSKIIANSSFLVDFGKKKNCFVTNSSLADSVKTQNAEFVLVHLVHRLSCLLPRERW